MGLTHASLQVDYVAKLIMAVARLVPFLPDPVENFNLIAVGHQCVEFPLHCVVIYCHRRMQSVVC